MGTNVRHPEKGFDMLSYALAFLVIGLIAGALGLTGVTAVATEMTWVLFVIGIILLVIHLVMGRTARVI